MTSTPLLAHRGPIQTTARERAIHRGARISRRLHSSVAVPPMVSGGARFLAGRLANRGNLTYQDPYGHLVEADLSDYMERIGFFGAHGSRIIRYLTAHLRPGDWVIDAGANVGLMTSPLAAAVGPQGFVWAIEPLPRNIERLRRLREVNGLTQIEVFPVAVSATASTGRLRLSSRPGGSGCGSGSFVAPWAGERYVDVPTDALDSLVAAANPGRPLTAVKIDVEGFEAEFLAGAEAALAMWKPLVICEFHDPLLRAAGSSSEQLLRLFARYGYHPKPPFGRPHGSLDGRIVDLLLLPG